MAIPFITSTGLFTRLGRLAGLLKWHATQQAELNDRRHSTLSAAFGGRVDLLGTLPASLVNYTGTSAGFTDLVVGAAQATLLDMVKADAPERTTDIPTAVAEVIRQMQNHADSKQRHVPVCTVSASVAASPANPNPSLSNAGNGLVVIATRQPTGAQGENIFAEQARIVCIADSRTGTTAGGETFQFVGSTAAATRYGYDWPSGSGVTAEFACCDPVQNDQGSTTGQSLLTNGGFDTWDATSLIPTGWALLSGAKTDLIQVTATNRRGTSSMGFLTGANKVEITQSVPVVPQTAYAVSFSARLPATLGSFTSFTAVVDGIDSTGTVVAGTDGNNLSLSCQVLNADGLNWVTVSGVWYTPRQPIVNRVRVRLTAYTGDNPAGGQPYALVDDLAITPLLYAYPGGPGLAAFAGIRDWVVGDGFEATITNNRAGADYGYTWQAVFDRFFDTRASNLYLPSGSASGTDIVDSLIDTDPAI